MYRQASLCSGKLLKLWGSNRETCSRLRGSANRKLAQVSAPRPADRTGLGGVLLLAVFARPRPEQGVAFTAFVIEQVRVDRRVEGGVVELEREVVAAFLRALRPSCTDLRPAHVDTVARS